LQNAPPPEAVANGKRKRAAAIALLALIAFAAVAVILTSPLAAKTSTHLFNPATSHDGVGTIAQAWFSDFGREHGLIRNGVTRFFAYPFGYDLKGSAYYPLTNGTLNLMTKVIGAQASYNLMVLVSFPMAGLLMFLLVYSLTSSVAASMLSGFIYAFSPWHTARSFDQVGLAQVYVLPLFLLSVVFLWRRRSALSALAVCGSLLIAVLTDFHFGVFCGLLLLCWGVAAAIAARPKSGYLGKFARACLRRDTWRVVGLAALAVAIALALSAPFMTWLIHKDPMVEADTGERGIEVTAAYSSRPWNYVVPPAYALVWRGWTNEFVTDHVGKSGVHEVTAYPGIVTYCMAAAAVFLAFRRRGEEGTEASEEAGAPGADSRSTGEECMDGRFASGNELALRTTVFFGIIAACAAFVLSMPPIVHLGGATIPTPSIIMRALAPPFRFYSRWALVVTFSLALLAGVGLLLLSRSRGWTGRKAAAACLALVAVFAIDVTIVPPLRSRATTDVPAVVKALEREPAGEPVAFYPLSPGRYFIPLWYQYFQMFHKHPMLNGSKPGTEGDLFNAVLKDIYAPYTPAMLKGLGIKKVAVLNAYFKIMAPVGLTFDPEMMPEGYRLSRKTPDGYLFEVVGPSASIYPLYLNNFSPPAILEDGKAWSAMLKPTGEFEILNDAGKTTRDFFVTFNNPGGEGTIAVVLDGKSLGNVKVAHGDGELRIPSMRLTRGKHALSLRWNGRPASLSGAPFGLSGDIDLYLLLSRPRFGLQDLR